MATAVGDPPALTTGDIERRTGAPLWAIRRMVDRLFPSNPRLGPYRIVLPDQVGALEEASRPYIKSRTPEGASHARRPDPSPPADAPPAGGSSSMGSSSAC